MTEPHPIAVVVGSLRKESLNLKLAKELARLAPPEFDFTITEIGDLPLFNQDHEREPHPAVDRFRAAIAAARGVVFVTPEYNRSISGVLKNAIDIGSRPYGKSVWTGKPAGIAGVSPGPTGTAMAQQHLRNVIAHLDMPVLGQPEVFLQAKEGVFGEDGSLGAGPLKLATSWMERYAAWVRRFAS